MKSITAAIAVAVTVTVIGIPAQAQRPEQGKAEFALLQAVNFVMPGGNSADDILIVTAPTVSPGIRISYWTHAPIVIDFGLSFLHASEDNNKFTALMLEGGVGMDLAGDDASFRPFVSILVGGVSLSNGDTESEMYVGAQAGFRKMFRDYAATRLQIGYRSAGGEYLDLSVLEIAGGLSFFL